MSHRSILISVLVLSTVSLNAQEFSDAQRMAAANSSAGKDFWLVIPPNEIAPYQVSSLEAYIASAFDTQVTVYDYATDRTYQRNLNAGEVRTLHSDRGETSWNWEVREYQTVLKKAIRFTADELFTLSWLNAKRFSSEGTTALPRSSWGTEYVITSYYDFKEFNSWAGGFCIVAAEDDTEVTILLRGVGADTGQTSAGSKIGDTISVTLNEGDVYCVKGNGETRGVFDLTGTLVTSNVPIGVVNFHQRSTMPNILINGNGRDHLVEWALPVEQWSTEYITRQLVRNGERNLGDIMRVIALEDDTRWSLRSYDPNTGNLIANAGGVLGAGSFAEITHSISPIETVRGVSIWEADKPIAVVQYATSANFDGHQYGDPFQINLVPENRWTTSMAFQVPTDDKFLSHTLQLVFRLDPNTPNIDEVFEDMTLNGDPIGFISDPPLALANVPGTDVWQTTIDLSSTTESYVLLTPDVPTMTFLYGYGQVDSYGWSLGGLHPNIVGTDSMPPAIIAMGSPLPTTQLFSILDTITHAGPNGEQPKITDRIDAGIASVRIADNSNLSITYTQPLASRMPEAGRAEVRVELVDPSLPGSGTLVVWDYVGNESKHPIEIAAITLPEILVEEQHGFGTLPPDSIVCTSEVPFVIRNKGVGQLEIYSIDLVQTSDAFSIDQSSCSDLPIRIGGRDSLVLPCICFQSESVGDHSATLRIATNDQNNPVIDVTFRARVEEPVSVDEESESGATFVVQSNESEIVVHSTTRALAGNWTLVSMSGSIVKAGTFDGSNVTTSISTVGLASGVYVVHVDGLGSRVISVMSSN